MPSSNDIKFNEAALEILFKKHFISLCIYCQKKYGFELDVAKEAVHTSFIKLWENREKIADDQTVKAYLYRIVANTSLDMLRHDKVKERHAQQLLQTSPLSSSVNNLTDAELKQLSFEIDTAISELPEQMRQVFELSRYENFKYAEIAAHLGISIKTVETQISRALVKLRQKLSHYLATLLAIVSLNFYKIFLIVVGVEILLVV